MKDNVVAIRNFIWNSIAGLINAAEAVIMSIIITRVMGLESAGIITISFAIGNLLISIGKYGVRSFQVTDVKERYSFNTYLRCRLITSFLMLAVSTIYMWYGLTIKGYPLEKALCIFFICMIYLVEAIEDVYWGKYQKKDRLDVGAKIFIIRWSGILLLFGVIIYFTHSMTRALFFAFAYSVCAECILLYIFENKLEEAIVVKVEKATISNLLSECFPLFFMSFLNFYVINAPKYALDTYYSDAVQACYGFVSMPVFVIGLLNGFIYQPILVHMACEWQEKKTDKIIFRMRKQCLIIIGLIIICEAGAYFLGIPVLSWLYHTDLTSYKGELLILLLGGGFLAAVGFFSTILTMLRCQRMQLHGYLIVSIVAFLCSKPLVRLWGTIGAALLYLLLIILLMIIFIVDIYNQIKYMIK